MCTSQPSASESDGSSTSSSDSEDDTEEDDSGPGDEKEAKAKSSKPTTTAKPANIAKKESKSKKKVPNRDKKPLVPQWLESESEENWPKRLALLSMKVNSKTAKPGLFNVIKGGGLVVPGEGTSNGDLRAYIIAAREIATKHSQMDAEPSSVRGGASTSGKRVRSPGTNKGTGTSTLFPRCWPC